MTMQTPRISKSWIITILPLIFGLAFASQELVTGKEVSQTEIQILDNFLLPAFLGSGSIGAAYNGHALYQNLKTKQIQPSAPQSPSDQVSSSQNSSQNTSLSPD